MRRLRDLFGGMRLTRRGAAFLVVAAILVIVAYSTGIPQLLYLGVFAAALVLVCLLMVRALRPRVDVTRVFSPHVIQAGDPTDVSLLVRNLRGSRSPRVEWSDLLPWAPFESEPGVLPALAARAPRYANAGNARTVSYDLRPPRRGLFPIGPLAVRFADPFGLVTSEHTAGETSQLVVTPEVVPLGESGLAVPAGDGEARIVQRRSVGDADDTITREYRRGDALRRVHWRASARKGDLMVRQEEQRSFPEARIIVDTLRIGYPDADPAGTMDEGESAAFEWVVRMLASVTVHLRRTGFQVTVDETGDRQLGDVWRDRRRTWGDEEFLTGLASVGLVDRAAEQQKETAHGPLFAVLSTPGPEVVEKLIAARRPGELAIAFMVRGASPLDSLDRSFGRGPVAPVIAERLADHGWLVVPVRPDDDPAEVWDVVVHETGLRHGT
jgi:uncharacterized protein (DUF58 family)